jgi:GNAT superfamily N-acetyltransferase
VAVHITASDDVPPEVSRAIEGGVVEFNVSQGPMGDAAQVFACARSDDGALLGGAMGRRWGKYCELIYLWVKPEQRKQGLGSKLLKAFEQQSIDHGCQVFILDTFSFQAPNFYVRHGYHVLHEMSGFPNGNTKLTMRKVLGPAKTLA